MLCSGKDYSIRRYSERGESIGRPEAPEKGREILTERLNNSVLICKYNAEKCSGQFVFQERSSGGFPTFLQRIHRDPAFAEDEAQKAQFAFLNANAGGDASAKIYQEMVKALNVIRRV